MFFKLFLKVKNERNGRGQRLDFEHIASKYIDTAKYEMLQHFNDIFLRKKNSKAKVKQKNKERNKKQTKIQIRNSVKKHNI